MEVEGEADMAVNFNKWTQEERQALILEIETGQVHVFTGDVCLDIDPPEPDESRD